MPKTKNRVELLGHIGQEPEIRSTQNGLKVATLSLATSESYKDKSGEWKETTDWHRVILWDKQADYCENYLKKGSKVMIEGKLKTRSFENPEGKKQFITEVIGREVWNLSYDGKNSDTYSKPTGEEPQGEQVDDDVPF